ncbi:MAG TPA: hypothetical protein VGC67_18225 [Cellulomonas sp.]
MAGLSRGVKIFLAVDVVLVLVLIVAAIVVLGNGGADSTARTGTDAAGTSATTSDGETSTDGGSTAAATPGTTATSTDAQTFASPSGNITCTMSGDGVTCSIAHVTYTPPTVDGCTGSTGHVIVLNTDDGVSTPCVDGADPSVASADVTVLEYGRSQQVGPYTCTSATNGMSCVVDDTGTGFRVATAELALLS